MLDLVPSLGNESLPGSIGFRVLAATDKPWGAIMNQCTVCQLVDAVDGRFQFQVEPGAVDIDNALERQDFLGQLLANRVDTDVVGFMAFLGLAALVLL